MKIITFGSCLSRYTANNYVKIFGGEILASVYHNRSDFFVKKFIEGQWGGYSYSDLFERILSQTDTSPDGSARNILKNQFEEGLGKHRLSKSKGLFESLRKSPELIIVDNYMDLSGRLIHEEGEEEGVFLRLKDFSEGGGSWRMGEYLSPKDGVDNMKKVIDFLRSRSPSSKVVFINFPHDTYEDKDREFRHEEYSRLVSRFDFDCIPCLDVHEVFRTKDRQHFKAGQYCAYAGIIKEKINAGRERKGRLFGFLRNK